MARTGHIGFNEPVTAPFQNTIGQTGIIFTRMDAVKDFGKEETCSTELWGINTILKARKIFIMAFSSQS
ncbi:MAG: hypothetical protein IPL08_17320 [Saprospiraceae bacterium]|nr:hypothetical protein [Saprospiraceae bacterium]